VSPPARAARPTTVRAPEPLPDRLRAFRKAGVDVLRLAPQGKDAKERIENLEQQLDLIGSISE